MRSIQTTDPLVKNGLNIPCSSTLCNVISDKIAKIIITFVEHVWIGEVIR